MSERSPKVAPSMAPAAAGPAAPRATSLRAWIVGIAAAICCAITGLAIFVAVEEHRGAIEVAATSAANMARILEEHTARSFEAIDLVLHRAADVAGKADLTREEARAALHAELKALDAAVPQIRALVAVDADGLRTVDSSTPAPERLDLSHRDYFIAQRDGDAAGTFIGAPVRNLVSGEWLIGVSRRLARPEGGFGGIVLAVVDPTHFGDLYRTLNVGRNGTVALHSASGVLLAREPFADALLGRSFGEMPLFTEHILRRTAGTLERARLIDGAERIVSWRAVQDHGLVVMVGIAHADVLANVWPGFARSSALWAVAVIAVVGLAAMLIVKIGQISRMLASLQQAQAALKESEERFELALRGANDGIWDWDLQSGQVYYSPVWLKIMGYESRPLAPTIDAWRATVHEEDIEATAGLVREYLAGTVAQLQVTFRARHGSGRWIWVQARGLALRDDTGTPYRVLGTINDVTRLKQMEESLIAARDAAYEASRAKSHFLANMSHELRTPLNAVLGFSEMIRLATFGPVGNPRYIEYAKNIHDSGLHLLNLINDILDLSKIEAGRMELVEETIDVAQLVQACVQMVAPRALEAGIELRTDVAPGLPPLRADALAIKQLLINLLANAIKFSPQPKPVDVAAQLSREGDLVLRVRDHGIGMTGEELARVFEPFHQADALVRRRFGGTGLGLAISRRLAVQHGGTIQVDSMPDRGTTVTVTLPRERLLLHAEAAAG